MELLGRKKKPTHNEWLHTNMTLKSELQSLNMRRTI